MVEARALELLAIAKLDGLSRDELRRAYLRAVKAHPPERDADGFREVRAAYEHLQQALQLREFAAAVHQAEERAGTSEEDSPASTSEEDSPASPPELEAATVEVPARGADVKPQDAVPARLMDFTAALEAKELDRAALALIDLYESPTTSLESLPPFGLCLKIATSLFASGEDALARRLLGALNRHAQRMGSATQLDTFTAARWVLVKELAQVSDCVEDPRVARALAQALLTDDLSQAARTIDRIGARRATLARELPGIAPSLWAALLPYMRVPQQQSATREGTPRWIAWVGFVVLSAGFRLCVHSSSSSSSTTSSQASRPQTQQLVPQRTQQLVPQRNDDPLTTTLAIELNQASSARDCSRIRITWPAYVASLRDAASKRQKTEALVIRLRVRRACPDLESSLEKLP